MTGASEISGTALIRGARLIDPVRGWDRAGDLLMGGGVILAAGDVAPEQVPPGCQVIDGRGLVASPGFIDLHCHLREPGYEYKETIASGSQAAARGGFTTLCCMPNTDPPIDSQPMVEFIHTRAASEAAVRIFPIGCVTKGRKGRQLADMEELANSGVVAFSDDGDPVEDPNLMRLALTYSYDLGLPVSNHCQDLSLSCNGVMAEGAVATRLGLPGIPAAAEEAMIARDISLAEMTNGRLHLAHLSTAGSVALLRQAKAMNLRVTAEVCPHHLTVTDQWVMGARGLAGASASPYAYDTATKVYPPLRTQHDADVLVEALAEGVIDAIATDHAPHDGASKQVTYEDASFGISVLETALGLLPATGPSRQADPARPCGPADLGAGQRHRRALRALRVVGTGHSGRRRPVRPGPGVDRGRPQLRLKGQEHPAGRHNPEGVGEGQFRGGAAGLSGARPDIPYLTGAYASNQPPTTCSHNFRLRAEGSREPDFTTGPVS